MPGHDDSAEAPAARTRGPIAGDDHRAGSSSATPPDEAAEVVSMVRQVDLCCSLCRYGIVCRTPPERCPMCGSAAAWIEPTWRRARRGALHERLAG